MGLALAGWFFDLINSSLPAGQVGALIACISSRIITVNSTHRTPPAGVRACGGPAARPGLLPGPLCFVGYRGLSPVQAALDTRVRLPHLRGKCLGPGQDGPRRRSLARPRPAWPWQGRGILGMLAGERNVGDVVAPRPPRPIRAAIFR